MNILYRGYIIVFLGAGVGGVLRQAVNRAGMRLGVASPWSTLCVNVTGCLAMGMIAGWFAFRGQTSQPLRLFLTTGMLGGYTTFSAFSLDAALLWERGQVWSCALYIASSLVLTLAGVLLGLLLMRRLLV